MQTILTTDPSMGNYFTQKEDKLFLFMKHAATGIAEVDINGSILHLNNEAAEIIGSFQKDKPFTTIFEFIASINTSTAEEIEDFITSNTDFSQDQPALTLNATSSPDNHFLISVYKFSHTSIILSIEKLSDKRTIDKDLNQALLNKAVVQGKYEIASNILHDIGNAIVGFSSYLTRIKHSLEHDNSENLQNLVDFFTTQETSISRAIGEAKAGAIVKILSGIAQTQKSNHVDISKSISEQHNIITHIQEILNIQREYVNGNSIVENRSAHPGSIIKDCMSMLFASLNKRNITVVQNIPDELPVIKGERTQLMQVILNILKNSIEAIDFYSVEKTISITVNCDNNLLTLQIQDSGKGFDETVGKKLFTRGFTTKSSGSGLGLEHCRSILESNGSSIEISSEGPGKGALTIIKFKI